MSVGKGARESYAVIEKRGPMTARSVAGEVLFARDTVRTHLRNLEAEGHLVAVMEFPERVYALGPVPLAPEPERKVVESMPSEQNVHVMRERVHAKAIDAGLEVQVDARAGLRLSVPHPFDEGRVWLDTPGDLDAFLIDRKLGRYVEEGEWRAAA